MNAVSNVYIIMSAENQKGELTMIEKLHFETIILTLSKERARCDFQEQEKKQHLIKETHQVSN